MLGALLRLASFGAAYLTALEVNHFDGMGFGTTPSDSDPFAFAAFVSLWVGSWWLVWWVGL